MHGWRSDWTKERALRLYCDGHSDTEIADRCGVSPHTVKSWKRLYHWRPKRATLRASFTAGIPAVCTGSLNLDLEWERSETAKTLPGEIVEPRPMDWIFELCADCRSCVLAEPADVVYQWCKCPRVRTKLDGRGNICLLEARREMLAEQRKEKKK